MFGLTETSRGEWSCLTGGGEEEDGLVYDPQESPSGQDSCQQMPHLLPNHKNWMMMLSCIDIVSIKDKVKQSAPYSQNV